ncbi:unnamed protein product [Chironomus riparius]|uniref:DUF243 domain-containing protein n=1 Tax=Chironomus riparius TaxID=315576 RepID=A0A9N9RTV3_9DIPT|nr:unnamed protein product [Chironomus riparius]
MHILSIFFHHFQIFATLTAVVLARPDVSHLNGYKYNQPGGGASNGIASGNSFSNAGAGFSGGNNYQGGYTDSASFGSSASGVTSGAPLEEVSVQVSSSASANGISGSGYSSQSTGLDAGYQAGSNGAASGSNGVAAASNGLSGGANGFSGSANGFSGSSNGFSGSSNGFSNGANGLSGGSNGFVAGSESTGAGFSNGGQNGGINLIQGQSQSFDLTGGSNSGQRVVYKPVIKQGEPIITKNFYVHAAPEEDENVRVEEKVHVVRPQKTYKIIFIKAPSIGSSLSAANYPVYPQNEEKTIVYVLSKKNDDVSDIGEIPTPPPSVTHKPEVFFIKYKTKQEAADAVANIQSQLQQESESGATANAQSLSIGSTGSENDGGNLIVTSSGSANEAGLDQRITPDDIRDESGDIDETAFGVSGAGDFGGSGIQTITTSSASSETRVGPSGGQFALQASNFGPTGGQVITQTAQLPAGDALPALQTQYTEYNGGQTYTQQEQVPAFSPDSSGSSAEFIPQQFIKIDPNQSEFNNRQAYLPPNARRFRF